MPLNNQNLTNKTTLISALEALRENINYNLNCVKVAIVDTFYPENLTVSCKVANKRLLSLKDDGNQVLQDYPLIYAKVHYMGWGNTGITYPITQGMEGILLFNDREMETWFSTGQSGTLAYDRCHNLSDAIFICGVRSLPNMIELVADCFNIFYKNTYIRLLESTIEVNGDTTLTGNFTQTGNITQTGSTTSSGTITGASLVDQSGATGTFISQDSKTITVTNGIIKSIS